MAYDPANINHAGEAVIGVDVDDVFDGEGSAEEVTAGGVDDTLWPAVQSAPLPCWRLCLRRG